MLTIDRCVTPELLESALEKVYSDLAKPSDPTVEQICTLAERSELKLWAAEGLNDVWKAQDVPEKGLQTALALLAAGMLVGMELQKAAAEVSVLEDLYTNQNAPGSTEA